MVLDLGYSGIIFDCFWINNNQFILVSGLDYPQVFDFYLFDVSKNGGKTIYTSKSNISVDEYLKIDYFRNFNLKKRGCPYVGPYP